MKITIEGRTKPATDKKAVKFNGGQWAYCPAYIWEQATVGAQFDVEVQTNEAGFKKIIPIGQPSPSSAPQPVDKNGMTKEDWAKKDHDVAKQAVMKSCLECPALAEVVKGGSLQLLIESADMLFVSMWKRFNETN